MKESRPAKASPTVKGEIHLFTYTIVKPILDFFAKPIRMLYSVGFFLLRPVYFFRIYRRCYSGRELDPRPVKFKFLNPLEKHELAALFAWTWATISAVGVLFGGVDLNVEFSKWPLIGSLITSLVFQIVFFIAVIAATQTIRLVGGGKITRDRALTHATYYSFVVIFPLMAITLGAWFWQTVVGTAIEIMGDPPESGTAYPGEWGDSLKWLILFVAIIGLAFHDMITVGAQSVLLFLILITFIHPYVSFRGLYKVSLLRYTIVYISLCILYFLVTGVLVNLFETDWLIAAFMFPMFLLIFAGVPLP